MPTELEDLPSDIDLSPYSGRWIALAEGEIAGVGDTAAIAEQLGRRNRLREKLMVYYVEPKDGVTLNLPPLLERLRPFFAWHDQPVYLVGGAVRDILLSRETIHDLDFAMASGAIKLAFKVANTLGVPAYVLDRERDTGRVILTEEGTTLDFARLRGDDLTADLKDRDFTINAMALPAVGKNKLSIEDPCGGEDDLTARIIRQTQKGAVAKDPVRTLRAARLALELDFTLDRETAEAIRETASLLKQVSVERIRDEVLRLLRFSFPNRSILLLAELNLLPIVFPNIAKLEDVNQSPPHFEPVLAHTVNVLFWLSKLEQTIIDNHPTTDSALIQAQKQLNVFQESLVKHFKRNVDGGLDGRMLLRLGGLFHDVGKKSTQSIDEDGRIRFFGHDSAGAEMASQWLKHYHFSNEAVKYVQNIVAGHMRPLLLAQEPAFSKRAVYRFFTRFDKAGLDIAFLALADHLATYNKQEENGKSTETWEHLLSVVVRLNTYYFEQFEEIKRMAPLLTGKDLIEELGLESGPEVGRLIHLLKEAQATGEVKNRDQALIFVIKARN